jgi:hypothetical protein
MLTLLLELVELVIEYELRGVRDARKTRMSLIVVRQCPIVMTRPPFIRIVLPGSTTEGIVVALGACLEGRYGIVVRPCVRLDLIFFPPSCCVKEGKRVKGPRTNDESG